jgi:phosphoglycerol transferase MdoB-like AlkP superfamily enzyme
MIPSGASRANNAVPGELDLLAEIAQREGYRTLGVTGGGFMGEKFGQSQGFDRFFSHRQIRDVLRRKHGLESELATLLRELSSMGGADDAPILAFFHTYEVHSPYLSPASYQNLFGSHESEFLATSKGLAKARLRGKGALTPPDLESIEANYDRGIRYADDAFRRAFESLEARGFLDKALVIVTSDHGEELGEHGDLLHPGTLYDELLRVPLIMVGPGVPPGRVDTRLVSTLDVAPTILGLAGIEVPSSMQGRDLFSASAEAGEDDVVISQYRDLLYSVRSSRWKLIERRGRQPLLFNLRSDPTEQRNVARGHPRTVERLSARLGAWRQDTPSHELVSREAELSLTEEERKRLESLGYL